MASSTDSPATSRSPDGPGRTVESAEPDWIDALFERLELGVVVSGAYQGTLSSDPDDRVDGGAFVLQPELEFELTTRDHLHVKLGFAAGNGIDDDSPFALQAWAADLENDVRDVNGSGRSYLLTAWYRHRFDVGPEHDLAITAGLIDATDYLDRNRFANDEFTQFMNEALVNGPNVFAPSYDLGAALEWSHGPWELDAVVMRVTENDFGEAFTYVGAEVGYHLETGLGSGTYRASLSIGSPDFVDTSGERDRAPVGAVISADQMLGDVFGVWLRASIQEKSVAAPYGRLISGGLNVSGRLWNRPGDELGIGYASLDDGNLALTRSQVVETYLRIGITEEASVTFDAQWMRDEYEPGQGTTIEGWVVGVRATVKF